MTNNAQALFHIPDCSAQSWPHGLYLVATPIGNMADITVRALYALATSDHILCEDTRVSRKLLSHYGIKTPCKAYHDHSTEHDIERIIDTLSQGKRVCLISDAGMPMIADPGYGLVQACIAHAIHITSLPGANAPLGALQLSGIACDAFTFVGFLPSKSHARKQVLNHYKAYNEAVIYFESPHRIMKSLADVAQIYGGRNIAIARELTKKYEEIKRGSADELLQYYTDNAPPKGEIVIVIAPSDERETYTDSDLVVILKSAMRTLSLKDAVAHSVEVTGMKKAHIYNLALQIKNEKEAK